MCGYVCVGVYGLILRTPQDPQRPACGSPITPSSSTIEKTAEEMSEALFLEQVRQHYAAQLGAQINLAMAGDPGAEKFAQKFLHHRLEGLAA